MLSVVEKLLDETATLDETGEERFVAILRRWLTVVDEYGPAMVLVRSREGYLTRLTHGEPQTGRTRQDLGLGHQRRHGGRRRPTRNGTKFALSLYNALLNSREILDLRVAHGMGDEQL